MIPVSGKSSPCSSISSNCVIWQGPDIPCIDLCNGDTISDVIAKLAEKLCELLDAACDCDPNLSGLDLKCVLPNQPLELELVGTLQAIIDYICDQNNSTELPDITLPICLQYTDNLGNLVTELPLVDWATLVGNTVCNIINDIITVSQDLVNLEQRVVVLENCVLPCTPEGPTDFDVTSSCLFLDNQGQGQSVAISTLVLAIEAQFCELREAVGTVTQINAAIVAQCLSAASPTLSGTAGNYGNISGWQANPSTLAEINQNQWIVLCDLYQAVSDIQNNCCDTGCDGYQVSYTHQVIKDGNNIPTTLEINFINSSIPNGFNDCSGNTITTTDQNGNSITTNFQIVPSASGAGPVSITLSNTNLDVYGPLTLTVNACITDGSSDCTSTTTQIVPLAAPCPNVINVAATPSGDIGVTFTNTLGGSVTYQIDVINQQTQVQLGTATINNPGLSINQTFSGGAQGVTYEVIVSISTGGAFSSCPAQTVQVPGSVCISSETTATSATKDAGAIYIGNDGDSTGETASYKEFYFNTPLFQGNTGTIHEDFQGTPACRAPEVSAVAVSAGGTVTCTVSGSGTTYVLSYSTDGLTYTGSVSGGTGARSLATGQTSGPIYFRVVQDCGGGTLSAPYIIRYDFSTDVYQIISDPEDAGNLNIGQYAGGRPAGVFVARQYLECEGTQYSAPGASYDAFWYFVGKVDTQGTIRYLYVCWTSAGPVRAVLCCTCPSFILTDNFRAFCGEGVSTRIVLPYVLGDGSPVISISQNPASGTAVLTNVGTPTAAGNEITYSNTGNLNKNYADTFEVTITSDVQGECTSSAYTIQVQIIPCDIGLRYNDQDIYMFVDTLSIGNSVQAINNVNALATQLSAQFAAGGPDGFNWTGNLYILPTSSKRWLSYHKSIVDKGVSYVQSPDPLWQAIENTPASWATPGGLTSENTAWVLVISKDASTNYHDATLANGFLNQPTVEYKEDYETLSDVVEGTAVSVWAQGLSIVNPVFDQGIEHTLISLTDNQSTGADAAFLLQSIGAYTGELIPPVKYGIQTAVDLSGFIMQGLGTANPYQGATTGAGTAIKPLFDIGYQSASSADSRMLFLLDQSSDFLADPNSLTSVKDLVIKAVKGCDGLYPLSSAPNAVHRVQLCSVEGDEFIDWSSIPGAPPNPQVGDVYFSEYGKPTKEICYEVKELNVVDAPTLSVSNATIESDCDDAACSVYEIHYCAGGTMQCSPGAPQPQRFFAKIATKGCGDLAIGSVVGLVNTGPPLVSADGDCTWANSDSRCFTVQACLPLANFTNNSEYGTCDFDSTFAASGDNTACQNCQNALE